jgi:hypothetical protein
MNSDEIGYEGWAFVELMGHRRLAGKVSEATVGGAAMLRLDVYDGDAEAPCVTQFYGSSAIYCLTPTAEPLCRAFGRRYRPAPVTVYELPAAPGESRGAGEYDDVQPDDSDDEDDEEQEIPY